MTLAWPSAPEETVPRPLSCRCETCKLLRFEKSKLRDAIIHEYSYEPEASWKFHNTGPNDRFSYYLGVELETDSYHGRTWSDVDPAFAADMRRPKNFWVPKHDSSCSGPEFASHPATFDWWRKHRRDMREMFRLLLHAGYRSHDNDTCGMHINISRNAFDSTDHLYRFLTLMHINPTWTLRMSQRSLESARQWAALEAAARRPERRFFCDNAYLSGVNETGHRYVALNPVGRRFEFRLPRGTLRLDRFYKNLEWTVAMIEYTRDGRLRESNPIRFMKWVRRHQQDYPNLIKFLDEMILPKYEGDEYVLDEGGDLTSDWYRPRRVAALRLDPDADYEEDEDAVVIDTSYFDLDPTRRFAGNPNDRCRLVFCGLRRIEHSSCYCGQVNGHHVFVEPA